MSKLNAKQIISAAKPGLSDGYKVHRPCRKAACHLLFDSHGREAVMQYGEKAGLSPNTLRTWMATWQRQAKAEAAAAEKAAKAEARRARRATKPAAPAEEAAA